MDSVLFFIHLCVCVAFCITCIQGTCKSPRRCCVSSSPGVRSHPCHLLMQAQQKKTTPLPCPFPSRTTFAYTTVPASLKTSLRSCHDVLHARLPTKHRRPMRIMPSSPILATHDTPQVRTQWQTGHHSKGLMTSERKDKDGRKKNRVKNHHTALLRLGLFCSREPKKEREGPTKQAQPTCGAASQNRPHAIERNQWDFHTQVSCCRVGWCCWCARTLARWQPPFSSRVRFRTLA